MIHRHLTLALFLILLALTTAFRQNWQLANALPVNFTVPTRTPTKKPPSNSGGGGGGGNNQPAPTAEPTIEDTPTATAPPIELAATPVGGYLPTAEACSNQPTVQAAGAINVRRGPGTEFEIISGLVYWEVRPITGRSANVPWWQIELVDGRLGWVSDTVVAIHGNSSVVPIVLVSSSLTGTSPENLWSPAPVPGCSVGPVWTSTPTATETVEPTLTPSETTTPPPSNTPAVEPATTGTKTTAPVPLILEVTPTQPAEVSEVVPITTAVPLDTPPTTSTSSRIFPFAAGGAIAVGVIVSYFRRQRQRAA